MWIEIVETHIGEAGSFLKGENRDVPNQVVDQLPEGSWRPSTAPWERQVDPLQKQIDQAHANFRKSQQDLIRQRQALSDLTGERDVLLPEIEKLDRALKKTKNQNDPRLLLHRQILNAEIESRGGRIELANHDIADLESLVARAQKRLESLQKQKDKTNEKPETSKPEAKAEGADDVEGQATAAVETGDGVPNEVNSDQQSAVGQELKAES